MKEYEVKTTQRISQEQIDDVLVAAFEGGITYWCGGVKVNVEPEEDYTYASEVLTRGGTLKLYDLEEKKWYGLTIEKLLDALSDMHFDFDNYDAGDADSLVQKAIFGEVVYG